MPELSPKRWGGVVRQIVRNGIPGSGNSMSKITKGLNSLEFELNSIRQWEPLKDSELGNGFINLPFFFSFLLTTPCSMRNLSSPIRDRTHAPYNGSRVLTTGLPGKPQPCILE